MMTIDSNLQESLEQRLNVPTIDTIVKFTNSANYRMFIESGARLYVVDGISEEVFYELSKIPGITVQQGD